MEIVNTKGFLEYYEDTRNITNKVFAVIPHDKLDWTYRQGKFTIGDLIRHIAAIERFVFAELAQGNKPCYKGCKKDISIGYNNVFDYFEAMHSQTVKILGTLSDASLSTKISLIKGRDITVKTLLRNMIIHEVHHRGALCIYLNLLGVSTPPVLGLMEEQLIELSK
jgi:uncharacterized damage-inducible protein DinB